MKDQMATCDEPKSLEEIITLAILANTQGMTLQVQTNFQL